MIGSVTQILKNGKQPFSVPPGGKNYAEGPGGAPEWGVRPAITLLFLTEKHETTHDGKSFVK